jgi:hypothetical protein
MMDEDFFLSALSTGLIILLDYWSGAGGQQAIYLAGFGALAAFRMDRAAACHELARLARLRSNAGLWSLATAGSPAGDRTGILRQATVTPMALRKNFILRACEFIAVCGRFGIPRRLGFRFNGVG